MISKQMLLTFLLLTTTSFAVSKEYIWGKNPFFLDKKIKSYNKNSKATAPGKVDEKWKNIIIEGIVDDGNKKIVFINSKVKKVGDKIKGAVITEIAVDYIKIKTAGGNIVTIEQQ